MLEYIHDDADLIFYETVDGVDVEFWKSPHTEEYRGLKSQVKNSEKSLWMMKKKIRFAVRRIKGQSRPQMILQVEELTDDKIVLNVITHLDTGQDLYGINNTNKVRFILDLGEKDLVGK